MLYIVLYALTFLVVLVALVVMILKPTHQIKRPVQNYKVRFEPANNKYFIVNETATRDVPVVGFFGFRIFYESLIDADFVAQKLNNKE